MSSLSTTVKSRQAALLRACRLAGGRRRLARQINASTSQIGNWVNRGDLIPYHYALLIAKATNNAITLDQLCPEMSHVNRLMMQQKTLTQDDATRHEQIYAPAVFPNTAPFTAPDRLVDLVDIYHWLSAQGMPVKLEEQEGGYQLSWQHKKSGGYE